LLHSCRGLRDVDIPSRIDGDLVSRSDDSLWLNVTGDLEGLAIEDEDAVAAAHVKELLVRIRRQREIARKRNVSSHQLLQKCAVFREHLNAPVFAIGDIDGSILRDSNGMDDAELLRAGIGETFRRDDLAVVVIGRLIAERAPHTFERAAVRIEYRDAVIA